MAKTPDKNIDKKRQCKRAFKLIYHGAGMLFTSCPYSMVTQHFPPSSVTREKSPNVHKSCPKMISLEKLKILASTQNLPKTVRDLGKLIAAKGFKKLPKVQ